jgi:hypothetical protein
MKQRISFFKKIKVFFYYKKTIKKLAQALNAQHNIRIDSAYRMYTVLNLPEDIAPYIIKKSDREQIAEKYIIEITNKLSNFLNANGLAELYSLYSISKVGETNYLLVYGYSLIQTDKMINNLYTSLFLGIGCAAVVAFVYFLNNLLNF